MKNRIMTGVLFAVLLVAVMFAHQTVVLNIVVAAVSLVAVYEGLRATGFEKNKPLTALCIVFCVVTKGSTAWCLFLWSCFSWRPCTVMMNSHWNALALHLSLL